MSLFDKLRRTLGGTAAGSPQDEFYEVRVRCRRCGELLATRINLLNELSLDDSGDSYRVRKLITGSGQNRCFARVEVWLNFDLNRQLLSKEAVGGDFVEDTLQGAESLRPLV
jgi:hypothetical protein